MDLPILTDVGRLVGSARLWAMAPRFPQRGEFKAPVIYCYAHTAHDCTGARRIETGGRHNQKRPRLRSMRENTVDLE